MVSFQKTQQPLTAIFTTLLSSSSFMNMMMMMMMTTMMLTNKCMAFTQKNQPMIQLGLQQSTRIPSVALDASSRKFPCRCPDDDDNNFDEESSAASLEDRREAMFAMMGSLWASTGVIVGSAATTTTLFVQPANAVYGTDAKIVLPDPIQGMSDRVGKQCLVESLGNRECLVYREDEEKLLYKGADIPILLERIQRAALSLEKDIPPLVEAKKWTQLTGVLTGPMGQLSSTMALLEKASDNPGIAKQNSQKVKQDVFAIGTAVTNKQGDAVLKYRQAALEDLAIFLKAL